MQLCNAYMKHKCLAHNKSMFIDSFVPFPYFAFQQNTQTVARTVFARFNMYDVHVCEN